MDNKKTIKSVKLSEELVFDADMDKDGKGITPDEIIKMLKKKRNEQAYNNLEKI